MIDKISLKDEVNSVNQLFQYKEICRLNNNMFNVLQNLVVTRSITISPMNGIFNFNLSFC